MTKTMGQIAYEAFASAHSPGSKPEVNAAVWRSLSQFMHGVYEATANAILEEAAKIADARAKMHREAYDRCFTGVPSEEDHERARTLAIAAGEAEFAAKDIRSLKSTKEV